MHSVGGGGGGYEAENWATAKAQHRRHASSSGRSSGGHHRSTPTAVLSPRVTKSHRHHLGAMLAEDHLYAAVGSGSGLPPCLETLSQLPAAAAAPFFVTSHTDPEDELYNVPGNAAIDALLQRVLALEKQAARHSRRVTAYIHDDDDVESSTRHSTASAPETSGELLVLRMSRLESDMSSLQQSVQLVDNRLTAVATMTSSVEMQLADLRSSTGHRLDAEAARVAAASVTLQKLERTLDKVKGHVKSWLDVKKNFEGGAASPHAAAYASPVEPHMVAAAQTPPGTTSPSSAGAFACHHGVLQHLLDVLRARESAMDPPSEEELSSPGVRMAMEIDALISSRVTQVVHQHRTAAFPQNAGLARASSLLRNGVDADGNLTDTLKAAITDLVAARIAPLEASLDAAVRVRCREAVSNLATDMLDLRRLEQQQQVVAVPPREPVADSLAIARAVAAANEAVVEQAATIRADVDAKLRLASMATLEDAKRHVAAAINSAKESNNVASVMAAFAARMDDHDAELRSLRKQQTATRHAAASPAELHASRCAITAAVGPAVQEAVAEQVAAIRADVDATLQLASMATLEDAKRLVTAAINGAKDSNNVAPLMAAFAARMDDHDTELRALRQQLACRSATPSPAPAEVTHHHALAAALVPAVQEAVTAHLDVKLQLASMTMLEEAKRHIAAAVNSSNESSTVAAAMTAFAARVDDHDAELRTLRQQVASRSAVAPTEPHHALVAALVPSVQEAVAAQVDTKLQMASMATLEDAKRLVTAAINGAKDSNNVAPLMAAFAARMDDHDTELRALRGFMNTTTAQSVAVPDTVRQMPSAVAVLSARLEAQQSEGMALEERVCHVERLVAAAIARPDVVGTSAVMARLNATAQELTFDEPVAPAPPPVVPAAAAARAAAAGEESRTAQFAERLSALERTVTDLAATAGEATGLAAAAQDSSSRMVSRLEAQVAALRDAWATHAEHHHGAAPVAAMTRDFSAESPGNRELQQAVNGINAAIALQQRTANEALGTCCIRLDNLERQQATYCGAWADFLQQLGVDVKDEPLSVAKMVVALVERAAAHVAASVSGALAVPSQPSKGVAAFANAADSLPESISAIAEAAARRVALHELKSDALDQARALASELIAAALDDPLRRLRAAEDVSRNVVAAMDEQRAMHATTSSALEATLASLRAAAHMEQDRLAKDLNGRLETLRQLVLDSAKAATERDAAGHARWTRLENRVDVIASLWHVDGEAERPREAASSTAVAVQRPEWPVSFRHAVKALADEAARECLAMRAWSSGAAADAFVGARSPPNASSPLSGSQRVPGEAPRDEVAAADDAIRRLASDLQFQFVERFAAFEVSLREHDDKLRDDVRFELDDLEGRLDAAMRALRLSMSQSLDDKADRDAIDVSRRDILRRVQLELDRLSSGAGGPERERAVGPGSQRGAAITTPASSSAGDAPRAAAAGSADWVEF